MNKQIMIDSPLQCNTTHNNYKSVVFHGVRKQISDCLGLELGMYRKKQEKGEI